MNILVSLNGWMEGLEVREAEDRGKWEWLDGSWNGQERERERSFMISFLPYADLPDWTPLSKAETPPTPFLQTLRDGLILVSLHNAILGKSKRQFGAIKTFHTDTTKPYRCAENLRFWIKAAEIRWETKLNVNVTSIVHGRVEAWPDFEIAILQWCRVVREEIAREWRESSRRSSSTKSEIPPNPSIQQRSDAV